MENEILNILTQYLSEERMGKIIANDEKYQAAKIHEIEVYDKFNSTLSEEQIKLFNDFISASVESEANIQRINYQQGMKDMFALIKSLS